MSTPLPLVKLGKEFAAIDDYQKRIPKKHPNILELEHLTIAGDVYIGANVTLSGTVIIIAVDGSVIMIPDGSVLVDKVVTGNLRILDH
jgi:UTP--glucose-1-phosphate uridylyltransferase